MKKEKGKIKIKKESLKDLPERDLFDIVFQHPKNSSYALVRNTSFESAGILDGDIVLLDQANDPEVGDIIMARFDGEHTIRQYSKMKGGSTVLLAGTPTIAPIIIEKGKEFEFGGVVVGTIRLFGKQANLALKQLAPRALTV